MKKIIVSTFVSLDGVVEAPHEWSLNYFDEEAAKIANEQLFAADTLLMGRVTYQGFAEAWPTRSGDFADKINSMAKYVVSTTLEEPLTWANTNLIKGNVAEEIAKLKQQPGQDILMYGTGQLTEYLLQQGLINEHRMWIVPVICGKGRRIFTEMNMTTLELVEAKTLPSGTVIVSHRPSQSE